jgi:hypothetical protein
MALLAKLYLRYLMWYMARHPVSNSPEVWQVNSVWCPRWLQHHVFREMTRRDGQDQQQT